MSQEDQTQQISVKKTFLTWSEPEPSVAPRAFTYPDRELVEELKCGSMAHRVSFSSGSNSSRSSCSDDEIFSTFAARAQPMKSGSDTLQQGCAISASDGTNSFQDNIPPVYVKNTFLNFESEQREPALAGRSFTFPAPQVTHRFKESSAPRPASRARSTWIEASASTRSPIDSDDVSNDSGHITSGDAAESAVHEAPRTLTGASDQSLYYHPAFHKHANNQGPAGSDMWRAGSLPFNDVPQSLRAGPCASHPTSMETPLNQAPMLMQESNRQCQCPAHMPFNNVCGYDGHSGTPGMLLNQAALPPMPMRGINDQCQSAANLPLDILDHASMQWFNERQSASQMLNVGGQMGQHGGNLGMPLNQAPMPRFNERQSASQMLNVGGQMGQHGGNLGMPLNQAGMPMQWFNEQCQSATQTSFDNVSSTVGGYSRHPGTFGMLNQAQMLKQGFNDQCQRAANMPLDHVAMSHPGAGASGMSLNQVREPTPSSPTEDKPLVHWTVHGMSLDEVMASMAEGKKDYVTPKIINSELSAGRTPAEILDIVTKHQVQMNGINLATAFHRLAKCPSHEVTQAQTFHEMLSMAELKAVQQLEIGGEMLTPNCCTIIAWSCAMLKVFNKQLLSALVKVVAQSPTSCQLYEVTNMLWACGQFQKAQKNKSAGPEVRALMHACVPIHFASSRLDQAKTTVLLSAFVSISLLFRSTAWQELLESINQILERKSHELSETQVAELARAKKLNRRPN
ncbi:Uncharacterized protein SCF082_LOCUS25091 [Durusdinium trenchii]|uniref:Uncharacterized protein n=1 Tax=Durusdinium trenchii TaxID=1381693 RepID=A0ABP0LYS7_9DINO